MDRAIKLRIDQIDADIKKEEKKRTTGIILFVISFFFLWPLFIVGLILWIGANGNIRRLQDERQNILVLNAAQKEKTE